MKIESGKIYSREELAKWFGIQNGTFTKTKEQKLAELKDYAQYELITTKNGNFKAVKITDVICDTYYKNLRKPFLKWLAEEDPWSATGENNISNATVVTNYYCHLNKIPYQGPHYLWIEDKGISYDGKRKITQNKKIKNPSFSTWHYLYTLARKYYTAEGRIKAKVEYDMSANNFNPIKITLTTEQKKEIRDKIYEKYYGKADIQDMLDIVECMENVSADDSAEELKKELLKIEKIAAMSDIEKRLAVIDECTKTGVLHKRGYEKN